MASLLVGCREKAQQMSDKIKIRSGRYFSFVAAAAAINVVVFLIGQAAGATYDVNAPSPVNIGIVIGMTIAQLAVGYLIALATARFAPKLFAALIWVGAGFAILSAPGGWFMSGDAATGVALGLMHVTGAVAWFFGVKTK